MKKAIIIGASSGMGKELAVVMSQDGYVLGIGARRIELLREIQKDLPTESHVKRIDISHPNEAMQSVRELISEMQDVDIVIFSSGISIHNPSLLWESERETMQVNVIGFAAVMNVAFDYFCEKGAGHLVGISSFRGLRGGWSSPAYNASKAFQSNYLEGLRVKSLKLGKKIFVTDIRPGLVVTPMTAGRKESLLVAPVGKAARQMFRAIKNRDATCYVTKRYRLVASVMRAAPYCLYSRI